jgi:hypothetical protein
MSRREYRHRLPGEAVLHVDRDRAAKGVEAEDRVSGDDRRLVDRVFRMSPS